MLVKELIEKLYKVPQDKEVLIFCQSDSEAYNIADVKDDQEIQVDLDKDEMKNVVLITEED